MTEVVGLAASIITLGGTCAVLGRTLLEVANIIESAEYEARLIAADVSVFSCSLAQLSKVVDTAQSEAEKLRKSTGVHNLDRRPGYTDWRPSSTHYSAHICYSTFTAPLQMDGE
jgi:hypothetical protein